LCGSETKGTFLISIEIEMQVSGVQGIAVNDIQGQVNSVTAKNVLSWWTSETI
jgi:hypothetical protein